MCHLFFNHFPPPTSFIHKTAVRAINGIPTPRLVPSVMMSLRERPPPSELELASHLVDKSKGVPVEDVESDGAGAPMAFPAVDVLSAFWVGLVIARLVVSGYCAQKAFSTEVADATSAV